ncbi:DUF6463 family protein [Nocardia stercoris]|uniref:Uncharacterized protein n=1 Tax=Nocardia stercoris TaxID=2483361 RepID=A0A3M2L5Q9_9NOCA|nr:DUF6463 family protein [Nocardia stercoris]RMI32989.1 hypothetical protein EBN03_11945 [Nocardia stercoris]
MIKWAGWLITVFGAAHTLLALTLERAARHAGTWFSGGLWSDDLSAMSPENSAFWLSVASFGVPLVLVGVTVLWMERHGITPPEFLAWALGIWSLLIATALIRTPWPIIVIACGLLLAGIRRAASQSGSETANGEFQ